MMCFCKNLFSKFIILSFLLSIFFLLFSCGRQEKATLIITDCLDQDDVQLNVPVKITIEKESKTWNPGEICEFSFKMKSETKQISIEVDISPEYEPDFAKIYVIDKNEQNKVTLKFYKPYVFNFQTRGEDAGELPGVSVYVDGINVGATNEFGFLSWKDKNRNRRAGQIVQFELLKANYELLDISESEITLIANQYEYSLSALFRNAGDTPGEVVNAERDFGALRSEQPVQEEKLSQIEVVPEIVEPHIPPEIIETPSFILDVMTVNRMNNMPVSGVSVTLDNESVGSTNDQGQLVKEINPRDGQSIDINFFKNGFSVVEVRPTKSLNFRDNPQQKIIGYLQPCHILEFSTEPENARVTIKGTGVNPLIKEFMTPFKACLPPDMYSWEIQMADYDNLRSSDYIDLKNESYSQLHKVLISASAEKSLIELARTSEVNQDWQNAISQYQQVPRPESRATASDYVYAQNRLGDIYLNKEQDIEKAINSFEQALVYADHDYALHFNLAIAYYQAQDYEKSLEYLNNVRKLKPRIPVDLLHSSELNVQFFTGMCQYRQFLLQNNEQARRNLGFLARQSLTNFINRITIEDDKFEDKKFEAERALEEIKREIG